MKDYIPYTYLIGWSKLNTWYYGSETSNSKKIANPQNLWTIYFTSSKHVEVFREDYGEPDIIEIRKKFKTKEKAIEWEYKILKKMRIIEDYKWLNRHDDLSYFNNPIPKNYIKIKGRRSLPSKLITVDDKQKFEQQRLENEKKLLNQYKTLPVLDPFEDNQLEKLKNILVNPASNRPGYIGLSTKQAHNIRNLINDIKWNDSKNMKYLTEATNQLKHYRKYRGSKALSH